MKIHREKHIETIKLPLSSRQHQEHSFFRICKESTQGNFNEAIECLKAGSSYQPVMAFDYAYYVVIPVLRLDSGELNVQGMQKFLDAEIYQRMAMDCLKEPIECIYDKRLTEEDLKIVRYINYGDILEEEEDVHVSREYYSFYELSNGMVFALCYSEFIDADPTNPETSYFLWLADAEGLNGKDNFYQFGQDIFDWIINGLPVLDKKIQVDFSNEEIDFFINFYEKNVKPNKDFKTGIVEFV